MNRDPLYLAMAAIISTHAGGVVDALPQDQRGQSVIAFNTGSDGTADLLIYGPIGDFFWGEGITAMSIVEQLGQITASTINVRINSDGGVVQDGLAIYNALKRHGARIHVTIDGIAASIASLIAMAGDQIDMPANTMMMLHAPHAGAWGNAAALREVAGVLDTFAAAMKESYSAKSKRGSEIKSMLTDGRDHWFTAAQAVAFGLADNVITDEAPAAADAATAAASLLAYVSAISSQPESAVASTLRQHINRRTTATAFAALAERHQRAVYAQLEETAMKEQCHVILAQTAAHAQAAGAPPAGQPAAPAAAAPAAPVAVAAPAAAVQPAPVPQEGAVDVLAQLTDRNNRLREVFAQFHDVAGVRDLEAACLADPRMTVEAAQQRLLARIGHGAGPLADPAASPAVAVQAGLDQRDKNNERTIAGILARANVLTGRDAEEARQDNPAARQSLIALAEASLIRAGRNTRHMTRDQIAAEVLAVQTTSDFPILLESAIHRILIGAYIAQPFTWSRFCAVGTLSDYRPHNRYHMGSFNDLKPVNEAGEYEDGVLSDGSKEVIQGRRKGRILQITPEVIVNDDLGAFVTPAQHLARAAGRTIEKDVYALLALNGGAGPTMSDGKALFHTDHKNIDSSSAVPTVASFDSGRQLMGAQMDPGGNDYLDIVPAIWLGPQSKRGLAVGVNEAEFDDEATKNQRKPNISRGLVRDIIDTPRLSGNAWYLLADPGIEPVFEVAFLDGVQTPTLEQEKNFRTDGLAWKVVHRYGVAAVGYRGAVKNAGA